MAELLAEAALAQIIGVVPKRFESRTSYARVELLMQPAFNGHSHLVEMSGEKMIAGNEHQFLGFWRSSYHFFKCIVRTKPVVVSAEKQLRLAALSKKFVGVEAAFGFHRGSKGYQRTHSRIWAACPQTTRCTKGKSCENDGKRILVLQPIECRTHVIHFGATVVLAFAEPGAAKIESQHRKPE